MPGDVKCYSVNEVLGEGSNTSVWKTVFKSTGRISAQKCFLLADVREDCSILASLFLEVIILSICDHPAIIKIYDLILTDKHIILDLEYVEGRELFEYIKNSEGIPEETCFHIFSQLIDLLDYMQKVGVAHRDLKLENIMIYDDYKVKLIDFGLATVTVQEKSTDAPSPHLDIVSETQSPRKYLLQSSRSLLEHGPWRICWSRIKSLIDIVVAKGKCLHILPELLDFKQRIQPSPTGPLLLVPFSSPNVYLKTHCGTQEYAAPEMYRFNPYLGNLADLWSLGIILYVCLTGEQPFGPDVMYKKALSEVSKKLTIEWPTSNKKHISNEAKCLVQCILKLDPAERITLAQIQDSDWFKMHTHIVSDVQK